MSSSTIVIECTAWVDAWELNDLYKKLFGYWDKSHRCPVSHEWRMKMLWLFEFRISGDWKEKKKKTQKIFRILWKETIQVDALKTDLAIFFFWHRKNDLTVGVELMLYMHLFAEPHHVRTCVEKRKRKNMSILWKHIYPNNYIQHPETRGIQDLWRFLFWFLSKTAIINNISTQYAICETSKDIVYNKERIRNRQTYRRQWQKHIQNKQIFYESISIIYNLHKQDSPYRQNRTHTH